MSQVLQGQQPPLKTKRTLDRLSFKPLEKVLPLLTKETLNIATTGDIHLDHTKVPTSFIITRLNEVFTNEYLQKLDVLVINGDLFERRVMFDSDSAYRSIRWIVDLLRKCSYFNVALHVLEGTPSHDNTQAKWFAEMIDHCGVELEFYYHNDLEITPLCKSSDLKALWIPDEYSTSAIITEGLVKQLLITHGMETVDYAFIHGMFVYQEPVPSKASHNEAYYESVVDNLIVINHIHTPTSSGKIRAPGSLCCLRHGEEEVKGHLCITHGPEVKEFFIKTPNNSVFLTIDVQNKDMADVISILDTRLELEGLQFIKLKLKRSDPVLASIPDLRKRYVRLNLTTKVVDDDIPEQVTEGIIDKPILVSIRPETLADLLLPRMEKYDLEVKAAAQQLLAEPLE